MVDEIINKAFDKVEERFITHFIEFGPKEEILRLLKLGLWADKHGIPAIQRVHDDQETEKWGPDITMKAILSYALDFIPKNENETKREEDKTFRVVRGGSWFNSTKVLRSARRNDYSPCNLCNVLGFRLVRNRNPKPLKFLGKEKQWK